MSEKKPKMEWLHIDWSELKPWSSRMARIARALEKKGFFKIYLIHDPEKEEEARRFALSLISLGIEVTVAADVRPKSFDEATPEEIARVDQAIKEADGAVLLEV